MCNQVLQGVELNVDYLFHLIIETHPPFEQGHNGHDNTSLIARFMGPTWGQHLGLTGPRWAPCWPHEPCYLGFLLVTYNQVSYGVKLSIYFLFYWMIKHILFFNKTPCTMCLDKTSLLVNFNKVFYGMKSNIDFLFYLMIKHILLLSKDAKTLKTWHVWRKFRKYDVKFLCLYYSESLISSIDAHVYRSKSVSTPIYKISYK